MALRGMTTSVAAAFPSAGAEGGADDGLQAARWDRNEGKSAHRDTKEREFATFLRAAPEGAPL